MLESFIITLREGLEAALAVGIALAYLQRTGRIALRRYVFAGVVAGILASIGGAVLFRTLPLNQDAFGGWVMLAAAALVGSTTVVMMKAARGLKGEIEGKVEQAVAGPSMVAGLSLFVVTLLLILREGVETVLFLTAVSLNTSALANFLAGVAGLAAATTLGYFFMTSGLRVHIGRFFSVTAGLLGLMVVQLTVTGLHELSEAQVLPSSAQEMKLIGPIVHNDTLFFLAMIGLAAALMLWPSPEKKPDPSLSEPEMRKLLKERKRAGALRRGAAALSIALVGLVGTSYVAARVEETPPPAEELGAAAGGLELPLSKLADGQVHWFSHQENGVKVRMMMVLSGGQLHAGLDACAICGAAGYRAKDRQVICRNCGSAILLSNIGTEGGCNPLPLKVERDAERILVPAVALADARARFAGPQDVIAEDPVCHMKLTAQTLSSSREYKGRTWYFCKQHDCRARFDAHPDEFAR